MTADIFAVPPKSSGGRADRLADLPTVWDAIIVGAGPAGGLAALRLAERGYRVLLVEAKAFPRNKVCGGCLNRRAWSTLVAHGLAPAIERAGAIELQRLKLVCGRRSVEWAMPAMRAVSRRVLDEIIVSAAVARGAWFAAQTHARIKPAAPAADSISVKLKHRGGEFDGESLIFTTKLVIAADGLTHSSLEEVEQTASRVAHDSRVGLSATVPYDGTGYPAGRLTMVVGTAGYVGVTRVEQGCLNLAAALSVSALRLAESPASLIATLLGSAEQDVPEGCKQAAWVGTAPLTRESRRWSARRILLVGDAAGYVEPFTGEGMSWALAGAVEVSRMAERGLADWSDELEVEWDGMWRKRVRRHQIVCRGLAWLLRRPRLAEMALAVAQRTPWLAAWIMQRVAGQPSREIPLESKV